MTTNPESVGKWTAGQHLRDRLVSAVGGMDSFKSSFNWRTFSPDRRAEQNIADGVNDAEAGLAELSASGATPEQADEWLNGFVKRWTAYQQAGARTMNWMITGPARFPVERNRKRMETEHKRSLELSEYVAGATNWLARRNRAAERREAVEADVASGVVHKEKVVNARLIAAAPEMAEELRFVRGLLAHSGAESGYCMCGDPVEGHNIGSGHSPVDSHVYAASQSVERIDAILAKINGAS